MEKCKAILKSGRTCMNKAILCGLCVTHYRMQVEVVDSDGQVIKVFERTVAA